MKIKGNTQRISVEHIMMYNQYKKEMQYNGVMAKTWRVLNLIFMRPGTIPSNPSLGIWIDTKKHMLDTPDNRNSLIEKMRDQARMTVGSFVSDIVIKEVDTRGFMTIDIITNSDQDIQIEVKRDDELTVNIVYKDFT